MQISNETGGASGQGLVARGRSREKGSGNRGTSRSKSKHRNLICGYCKKKGHIKADCFKLKNKEQRKNNGDKNQSQKNTNTEVEASVAARESDKNDIVFTVTDKTRRQDEWLMDSACSFHICTHREWFSTYMPIEGGDVLMENHSKCTVIRIGTVRVRIFDGVVRTISEVQHVPDMRKNLISLGTLDTKGFKYSSADGLMKVAKGNHVVMKAKLSDMLYVLQGFTVTGSAASKGEPSSDGRSQRWQRPVVAGCLRAGGVGGEGRQQRRPQLRGDRVPSAQGCLRCGTSDCGGAGKARECWGWTPELGEVAASQRSEARVPLQLGLTEQGKGREGEREK
uniref:Retrovirus-related Pol polyprotein from transposon TNT 1-94-like beta-barrel domain-containing protein n=1 Tax=Ananas comosus var. bracteatus TaxID=296719 RepID=A0A6V7QNC2_ANACO|nr:unnamed protein product [Ananas comosus var. bracteatus]